MSTRVRIVLPDDLLAEVDQMAGKADRSAFIAAAVREKLQRETQRSKTSAAGNGLDDIPGWDTPEDVAAWLRSTRQSDVARLVSTGDA